VLAVVALVGLGGLAQDLGNLFLELLMGSVGPLGGVAGQLGAVQRHRADPDHPGGRAQLQGFDQEPGQGLLVADAEQGDGHVVGRLVAGQDAEGDVLSAAPLDLAGGAHPDGVGVQQHADQRLGVVGGVAVAVGAVGGKEPSQVELVDHVTDEPGEVAFGQPLAQVGREQEGLVTVTGKEVVGHGPSYLFTAFAPNALITCQRGHGSWALPHRRAAAGRQVAIAAALATGAQQPSGQAATPIRARRRGQLEQPGGVPPDL
jgi:hypothetical protein